MLTVYHDPGLRAPINYLADIATTDAPITYDAVATFVHAFRHNTKFRKKVVVLNPLRTKSSTDHVKISIDAAFNTVLYMPVAIPIFHDDTKLWNLFVFHNDGEKMTATALVRSSREHPGSIHNRVVLAAKARLCPSWSPPHELGPDQVAEYRTETLVRRIITLVETGLVPARAISTGPDSKAVRMEMVLHVAKCPHECIMIAQP